MATRISGTPVQPVIVALGEALWDLFPAGPRFGGAPANFACHAAALGAEVSLISRVGDDDLGAKARAELTRRRVDTRHIGREVAHPTGTVQVALNAAGVPGYTITPDVAWDHLEWAEDMAPLAARADAVCFGTLGQRSASSRETIRRFVKATPATALRVFDVNLRPPFYDDALIRESLELANVFKLSDEELDVVARACGLSGAPGDVLAALRSRYGLRVIALTRGAHGALLLGGDEVSDFPGVPATVKDTVGAGDSFTAALTLGLLPGDSLDAINRHACRVAAHVCSQDGATPPLPDELTLFNSQPNA